MGCCFSKSKTEDDAEPHRPTFPRSPDPQPIVTPRPSRRYTPQPSNVQQDRLESVKQHHSNSSSSYHVQQPLSRQASAGINTGNKYYDPNTRIYKVLHNFDGKQTEELTIREGDQVEVIRNDEGMWWFVRNTLTKQEGYVPSTFIAKMTSLQAEPWFFDDTTRNEAVRMLNTGRNKNGSFLVRRAEHQDRPKNEFSLSLLTDGSVRHYKVQRTERTGKVFVARGEEFTSLEKLIDHYKTHSLHPEKEINLLAPCIRTEKPVVPGLSAKSWEIKKSSLRKVKVLGHGNFGEVWEGIWIKNNQHVAVKEMKPGSMEKTDFIQEADIMKTLDHKNLIKLLAVSTTEDPIYIITELMENGALSTFLRERESKRQLLDQKELIYMGAQVAHGMQYLEQHRFVHRDLAARNVLVSANLTCKVADFGLARCLVEDEYCPTNNTKFPVKWTAPEAFRGNFTTKSDVWSFGVLLAEIITHGKVPYPGVRNHDILHLLTNENFKMARMKGCPQKLYDIMLTCWHLDPNRRPGFFSLYDSLDSYFAAPQGEYKLPSHR